MTGDAPSPAGEGDARAAGQRVEPDRCPTANSTPKTTIIAMKMHAQTATNGSRTAAAARPEVVRCMRWTPFTERKIHQISVIRPPMNGMICATLAVEA